MRWAVYATNMIESVYARLRKILETREQLPIDDAANELIWLAMRNITADCGRAVKAWREQ